MIISVSGVIVGLVLGFMIGQYEIVKPIQSIVALLKSLAAGNFDQEIKGTERKDEVGDIAKTALVFKENGLEKIRMEAEQKELETFTAAQRKRDMVKLADDFEGAVGEIIETVSSASTELEASAASLTSTAERSQKIAVVVAAASEEASTNVQSVASATEEMSSSVNEISRQVQESARMASEAVDQARTTNERVGELSEAASRIGDVVELINTIAGQTNLLALNATIEAARAGEAGRGFAVVASEVKALAEQTAKATGEIGQQIAGIQAATGRVGERDQGDRRHHRKDCRRSPRPSRRRWKSRAPRRRKSPATCSRRRTARNRSSSNITDVQRGASETGSASSQVLSAAQSLSRRQQPPQARSRQVPEYGPRGLTRTVSAFDPLRLSGAALLRCMQALVRQCSDRLKRMVHDGRRWLFCRGSAKSEQSNWPRCAGPHADPHRAGLPPR